MSVCHPFHMGKGLYMTQTRPCPYRVEPHPLPPDMFKLVQLGPHSTATPGYVKFMHEEAHTVRKQAVGLLPKCFLVYNYFTLCKSESERESDVAASRSVLWANSLLSVTKYQRIFLISDLLLFNVNAP